MSHTLTSILQLDIQMVSSLGVIFINDGEAQCNSLYVTVSHHLQDIVLFNPSHSLPKLQQIFVTKEALPPLYGHRQDCVKTTARKELVTEPTKEEELLFHYQVSLQSLQINLHEPGVSETASQGGKHISPHDPKPQKIGLEI